MSRSGTTVWEAHCASEQNILSRALNMPIGSRIYYYSPHCEMNLLMPAMDAIDRRILAVLQEDASLSVADVSKRVGLSATPCWKRIQRLEQEGIILKRVAVVAPEKVGLGTTVYVSIETDDHS